MVAFSVDNIEKAAEIINTHPGASHNYERNHPIFNLWFTLAVPYDSNLGLEGTIKVLAEKTNAKQILTLPTIKMFKIGVILDTSAIKEIKEEIKKKNLKQLELTDFNRKILFIVQNDISLKLEPFKDFIEYLNTDYNTFFTEVNNLIESGYIRRFATLLNHRNAGFEADGMVVWNIPEDKQDEIGEVIASYKAVSHCYIRPKYPPLWNYNLYSMIHGKTKEEVSEIVLSISKEINVDDYLVLYSTREFKKERIAYFSPLFYEWEKNI